MQIGDKVKIIYNKSNPHHPAPIGTHGTITNIARYCIHVQTDTMKDVIFNKSTGRRWGENNFKVPSSEILPE